MKTYTKLQHNAQVKHLWRDRKFKYVRINNNKEMFVKHTKDSSHNS